MIWAMWRTFVRSFFLQTLWNFERMQNVGFAFSVAPLVRRISNKPQECQALLRRQLAYFNTHPYFATIVMGVVYAKEKDRGHKIEQEDPTLTLLKDSMGGAFGAIGDHVIWGTWRPFCALLALAIGALVASPTQSWSICARWWVLGFFILFNAVHVWLRAQGLYRAVSDGPMVVRWVESLHLQTWAAQIRRLGLLLVCAMILVYLGRWTTSSMLFGMMAVLLVTLVLKRWSASGLLVFYLVCGASVMMTMMGVFH